MTTGDQYLVPNLAVIISVMTFSALALATVLGSAKLPKAQDALSPGQMMATAFAGCAQGSKEFADGSEYGFKPGIAILGAYLEPGQTAKFETTLASNSHYIMTAGGSEENSDIDLQILDSNGTVVAQDADTNPFAGVSVEVGAESDVTYVLANGGELPTFACMVVLVNKDGWNIHKENLNTVISKVTALESYFSSNNYFFYHQPNQWCLVGGVVKPDTGFQAKQVTIPDGSHIAMGFGDTQAEDLDVFVQNAAGDTIAQDTGDDAAPGVALPDGYSGMTDFTLKNSRGGDALCLLTLFSKVGTTRKN